MGGQRKVARMVSFANGNKGENILQSQMQENSEKRNIFLR